MLLPGTVQGRADSSLLQVLVLYSFHFTPFMLVVVRCELVALLREVMGQP